MCIHSVSLESRCNPYLTAYSFGFHGVECLFLVVYVGGTGHHRVKFLIWHSFAFIVDSTGRILTLSHVSVRLLPRVYRNFGWVQFSGDCISDVYILNKDWNIPNNNFSIDTVRDYFDMHLWLGCPIMMSCSTSESTNSAEVSTSISSIFSVYLTSVLERMILSPNPFSTLVVENLGRTLRSLNFLYRCKLLHSYYW